MGIQQYRDGEKTTALARKKPALCAFKAIEASAPAAYEKTLADLRAKAPKDLEAFFNSSDATLFPGRLYVEFLARCYFHLGETEFEMAWVKAAMSYFDWEVAKSVWSTLGARLMGRPGDALVAAAGTWRQTMPGCGDMTITSDKTARKVVISLVNVPLELGDYNGHPRRGFIDAHRGISKKILEMAGAKNVTSSPLKLGPGTAYYELSY